MEIKTRWAQDKSGNVMPFASVALYYEGTEDLVSGLEDKNGNPLDNPFQSDINGKVEFAAPDGQYDIKFSSGPRESTASVQFLDVSGALQVVENIDTLRGIRGNIGRDYMLVTSHTRAGDGGGGDFYWASGSPPGTYVDNNGTIIVPTGGDGSAAWVLDIPYTSVYGGYKFRFLTGARNSLASGVPKGIKVGDSVNITQYSEDSPVCPATWQLVADNAALPSGAVSGDLTGAAAGCLYLANGSGYYKFEHAGDRRYLSQFGGGETSATDAQMRAMVATSKGRKCVVDTESLRLSNTITLGANQEGVSIIGETKNGLIPKIYRHGTADTWRACFHVETSNTFIDNLWLEPEEAFSPRCGISYGSSAGRGNRIGTVKGAYWDLGVVMPKLTPEEFSLDIDTIEAYYGGRTYSSDVIATPPGNIRIKSVRGFEAGFLDVSGGSIEIGAVSWVRHNADGMKKGAQQVGGTIKVGSISQTNTRGQFALSFGTGELFTGPDFKLDEVVTGQTSGATAKVHARHRRAIDIYETVGTFAVGENVVSSVSGLTFATTAVTTKARSTTFQNNGDNFDLIKIGDISAKDHHGDILWILNWGSVIIDSIRGFGLYDTRNVIRHSPAAGGAFPGGFGKTMKIGSVDLDGVAVADNTTWFPFFFESGGDLTCPSFKAINITKSGGPGSILYSNGGTLRLSNLHLHSANTFSRPVNINAGNNGSIIGALVEAPGARWATLNGNNWAIAHVRYTASASADGTGTGNVQTDVAMI